MIGYPAVEEVKVDSCEAASQPVAISIRHLSKTYPVPLARVRKLFGRAGAPVEALRDVSFDVREGEVFGLIGRNGAGKTTLAKLIATLVQPTAGAINVRGFDSVRNEQQVRAQVGLASAEERSFYWRLTIAQNLLFFARLYGMSDRAASTRIDELLARLELAPVARRRFGELSTGNKQRVAVARALLNSPPILLLDEPTRSLDPIAAARMRALINDLACDAARPVTVLLTSHNLIEVEELCARVAVISRGRLRALDAPKALRALFRQTERVRLVVRDLFPGQLEHTDFHGTAALEINQEDDALVLTFSREPEDDRLDAVLRAVLSQGGRVIHCEGERGSLLDVLELFEREQDEDVEVGA